MEAILLKEGNENALVLKTNNGNFLIDVTPNIFKKLQEEDVPEINCLILTKEPTSEALPSFIKWLSKKDLNQIVTLMPVELADKLKEHNLDLGYFEIMYYQPGVTMRFEGNDNMKVTPFSTGGGVRLFDVVFLNGGVATHKELENSKLIITNNCKWFNSLDSNFAFELQEYSKINPQQVVISNNNYPDDAIESVEQYWKEIQGCADTKFSIAKGNKVIKMKEHISQVLRNINEGMVISCAAEIYSGIKNAIVMPKLYNSKIDKFLYLMDQDFCYGVIRIKRPDKINLEEFTNLEDKHKITEDERKKWWPYKEILYCYNYDLAERYDTPKKISLKNNSNNVFIDEWNYEKQKLNDSDNWKILNALYSSKKMGLKVKQSFDEIINQAKSIYLELNKKDIKLDPEDMKGYSRELYNKAIGKTITKDLSNPSEILKEFEDKKIIKDFISIVECNDSNKVNILIRLNQSTEAIKQAMETKILKDLSFEEDVNFIWGDPEEPHNTYIPLYNLKLERIMPLKIIKMMEEPLELNELNPFYPMKSKKIFNEIETATNFMFEKTEDKYALEQRYNGYRALLIKNGNSIKLYSNQKKDVSDKFDTILNEAEDLINGDFIIDGNIVYNDGGRSKIANYIAGTDKIDDENKLSFQAFDMVYSKGDLTDKPWYERKGTLHNINFSKHIKETNSIIVEGLLDSKKAINFCRNLSGSNGAIIKKYNSKYKKDGENSDWITVLKSEELEATPSATTTGTTGISTVAGKKWKKEIIEASKK